MPDKLQLSFEENDADNGVLQSAVSLTKKSRKGESNQRNKNLSVIFLNNDCTICKFFLLIDQN